MNPKNSGLANRMNDFSFSQAENSGGAGFKSPEGWKAQRKAAREGQQDKSAMLDAEMNPPDNASMAEDEYEYWKSACSSCASMAEGDGKKYTHTYKDPKTGNTRKVRYGASGYTIAPGTKRGDSYCARSEGDMKSEGMDCSGPDRNTPMCLSRKKWKCKGAKSTG